MAAEFAASAAANAVGNLATEYASPYVSYLFRFGKIVEEFKNQRKQLESKKGRMKNDVDEATKQTEIIEKDVQEWLKEAEKELEETQSLEAEIERKRCFNWCSSWGWRYSLSKKVARKTLYITKLIQRCDFQRVGIRPPLQGIEFFPSKDFKSSKSSNSAFGGIMKALNTNGVNMIGLYGMPGVGKTTLAKEVGRHAKEQKLFDKVVMVTMSQTPNISNIQARIAELLGLKFETRTDEGKAEELWRGLKAVKEILIIIDDVWGEFQLRSLGIPFGDEHEGCKIFLTTRRQQACVGMNCQEKFQLDILSEDEAWALFKDNAGLKDATLTLINEAKEVASKCKGLPLAVVTIGKALKGEDLNGWKTANQRLKDSRHLENEDVYNCLKLSYDYLKEDIIQSCFLLCSLFPEDSHIGIESLIMFGIGYELFSKISSIEVLRMEIGRAIRKLQESGLLLRIDDDDGEVYVSMHDVVRDNDGEIYVSMHDVVRDFAHWVGMEKYAFMVREGLTEWPISESFGCYTSISFWESNINNFPDKLEFPKLQMFVFEGKNLVKVPSVFVEGMKNLQILHLKNVSFSLEAFIIVHLRTLCFENCKLENISSLRNLKNLEILALLQTNICELPEDLVELRRLKSLHFYRARVGRVNFPPNLLSRLISLQELHLKCRNNVNLSELNSLPHLTALSLTVSTDQCLQQNFVFSAKLQRYMIAVTEDSLRYMKGLKFRTLKIEDFSSSLSAFKELFCSVEKLALKKVMTHKNVVPSVDKKGLNELTSLELFYCKDMEYLIDTTRVGLEEYQIAPLSNLRRLELMKLPELKWIWKGPSHYFNLKSLKAVEIITCHKLKCLFSLSLAQSLVLLEQLKIEDCNGLEHVITELENDDNIESDSGHLHPLLFPNLTYLEIISCPRLEYVSLHPPLFPKLTSLQISWCPRLKNVSQIPLAQGFPHLKSLEITDADQLKHVFNVAKEKNAVDHAIALPCLQHLRLRNLINLSCFCSENYPIASPSLQELTLINCPQLEIFNIQQEDNKEIQLKELYLVEVGNECYTTSWEKIFQIQTKEIGHQLQGPIQFASLQYLRDLEVSHFNRLKSLFSAMVARNLSQLIRLRIFDCDELEEIIEMDQTSIVSSSSQTHLQPISFPSLECIWIKGCSNLKSLFPISVTRSLSKLNVIHIYGASKLEQVFGYQDNLNVEDDQKGIAFLALIELTLLQLPSLNSFAPTGYLFQFPYLELFTVRACLKLTSSFSMDSKHLVHAIREEPQQAQNNTANDINTIEKIVGNQSTSNDITWRRQDVRGQIPIYLNVGETRIMLH